jgi:hypothetical protein
MDEQLRLFGTASKHRGEAKRPHLAATFGDLNVAQLSKCHCTESNISASTCCHMRAKTSAGYCPLHA